VIVARVPDCVTVSVTISSEASADVVGSTAVLDLCCPRVRVTVIVTSFPDCVTVSVTVSMSVSAEDDVPIPSPEELSPCPLVKVTVAIVPDWDIVSVLIDRGAFEALPETVPEATTEAEDLWLRPCVTVIVAVEPD
jgi:hypothetical protein